MKTKLQKRQTRQRRVRAKISGTLECPRLAIFKSNSYIYAQLIDDVASKTIVSACDVKTKKTSRKDSKQADKAGFAKVDSAMNIGKEIAKLATAKGIKRVVFDRGGYQYTGRVKAVAEGARAGGLEF
ncbi:MAG: 50S ribosomal protein L18 [bacterium]